MVGGCRLPLEDCENPNAETDAEAVQLDGRLGKNRFPVPSSARPRRPSITDRFFTWQDPSGEYRHTHVFLILAKISQAGR